MGLLVSGLTVRANHIIIRGPRRADLERGAIYIMPLAIRGAVSGLLYHMPCLVVVEVPVVGGLGALPASRFAGFLTS